MKYKKVAFRAYFRRMLTHCTTEEAKRAEVNFIFKEGRRHGYDDYFMQKIYEEVTKSRDINIPNVPAERESVSEQQRYVALPYEIVKYKPLKEIAKKN